MSAGSRQRLSPALRTFVIAGVVACSGCGAGENDKVIVRVGRRTITASELQVWMGWRAPGHVVPDAPSFAACAKRNMSLGELPVGESLRAECRAQYSALKKSALEDLIASTWLIGESRRISVTGTFNQAGGSTGQVPVALQLLIAEREQAKSRLEARLRKLEPPITKTEIRRYYDRELRSQFERPERRYFQVIEHLPTKDEAVRFLGQIKNGDLSNADLTSRWIYEMYERVPQSNISEWHRAIYRAIFEAPESTYVGPVRFKGLYALFRVRRIVPRRVRPLSGVRRSIEARLAEQQHSRALSRFVSRWRSDWTPRTACAPGYVVPGCRENPVRPGQGLPRSGLQ
jgi:hypothetical protein